VPIVLLGAAEHAEILFKCLIGVLAGTICLGMIGCADVLSNIQEAA